MNLSHLNFESLQMVSEPTYTTWVGAQTWGWMCTWNRCGTRHNTWANTGRMSQTRTFLVIFFSIVGVWDWQERRALMCVCVGRVRDIQMSLYLVQWPMCILMWVYEDLVPQHAESGPSSKKLSQPSNFILPCLYWIDPFFPLI